MISRRQIVQGAVGALLVVIVLWLVGAFGRLGLSSPILTTLEWEEEQPSKQKVELFSDDKLEDKNPKFDPALIDSRPFGDDPKNMWQINASAAVIGLDILDIRDVDEKYLLQLYPSYAAAVQALQRKGKTVLPSINMLDGKAKQFDDGLYAELDASMTAHKMKGFHDTSAMVKAILGELDPNSEAYAWVWGGLEVGGFLSKEELKNRLGRADPFINAFNRDEPESKPIGFYTWSPELKRTFRFLRYFQKEWLEPQRAIADEIAAVLAANPDIMAQYERMLDFYAHLTNPLIALSFKQLADPANKGKSLTQIWRENREKLNLDEEGVHFLPYSTSKEVVLFNKLFPIGLPEDADLMMELVKAIRDGRVNLKPNETSGWYDYQVYALETFLLPERGAENEKLLLTQKYKERMLQAFAAMITKRRETHVRQLQFGEYQGGQPYRPPPRNPLKPRLRVEPNPTFFIRSARAYAFLQAYLDSVIPEDVMKGLMGRKEGGKRAMPLAEELEWMKDFFYGLHLISCEDVGMKPLLLDGELDDPDACIQIAADWLEKWGDDPDLAVDTRVAVPIYVDYVRKRTQLWATLGVRGAKLKAHYAKRPKWRPEKLAAESSNWQEMTPDGTEPTDFIILTDEFAEIQLKGLRVLSREELRKVCDRQKTKEKIIRALSR